MDWQFPVVIVAVAGALVFLGWSMVRTWSLKGSSCHTACKSCGKDEQRQSADDRRRLSLPQV